MKELLKNIDISLNKMANNEDEKTDLKFLLIANLIYEMSDKTESDLNYILEMLQDFDYKKNFDYLSNKYKGISWQFDGNFTIFYISEEMKKKIFKKYYKFLGIEDINEELDTTELVKTDDEAQKYIDSVSGLKDFADKLKLVNKSYDLYKQIQRTNASIRASRYYDKSY